MFPTLKVRVHLLSCIQFVKVVCRHLEWVPFRGPLLVGDYLHDRGMRKRREPSPTRTFDLPISVCRSHPLVRFGAIYRQRESMKTIVDR